MGTMTPGLGSLKLYRRWLALPLALAATLATGHAVRAEALMTPLTDAVQLSGVSGGSRASACGYLSDAPSQTLQVTEAFASLDITLQGEGSLTLLIEGPSGFSECRMLSGSGGNQISAPGLLNQGVYSLYVGNEGTAQTPYTLSIRQN